MKYCIEVSSGLWAFVLLLVGLSGLVMLGIGAVAVLERRAALSKRKVQVKGATRVGRRRRSTLHAAPAANDPDHGSWDK